MAGLAGGIAILAQSLEGMNEPECQAVRVRRRLYEYAELLLIPKDIPAPVFIEKIRDLADRIQEHTGRLAW